MNGVKTTLGELCERGEELAPSTRVAYTAELSQPFVAHAPGPRRHRRAHPPGGRPSTSTSATRTTAAHRGERALRSSVAEAQREVQIEQIRRRRRGGRGAAEAVRARPEVRPGRALREGARRELPELRRRAGDDGRGAGDGRARRRRRRRGRWARRWRSASAWATHGGGDAAAPPAGPRRRPPAQFSPGGGRRSTCGKCGAKQPGGKFCAECGTPLARRRSSAAAAARSWRPAPSSAPTAGRRRAAAAHLLACSALTAGVRYASTESCRQRRARRLRPRCVSVALRAPGGADTSRPPAA